MARNPVQPRLFKGTQDFTPPEAIARERIIELLTAAFRRFGFDPLETPALEFMDILSGKGGDEADHQIYRLAYEDGDTLGLRYDLTVSLARYVAMHPETPMPFRRYQIAQVWRGDRPQMRRGRFREFTQCDVDIVGSESVAADAEIVSLAMSFLPTLGFPRTVMRLSSRKVLLGASRLFGAGGFEAVVCRSVDKWDKIGRDGVAEELSQNSVPQGAIRPILELCDVSGSNDEVLSEAAALLSGDELAAEGVKETKQLVELLKASGFSEDAFRADISLARGLAYYTGPIFEAVLPDHPHIGSLTGGGRYDGLVGRFLGRDVPATGITIGVSRIHTALSQLKLIDETKTHTQVYVAAFDEEGVAHAAETTATLRRGGLNAEAALTVQPLKKQFAYADKKGIPLVVLTGPDERTRGEVAVKVLASGQQTDVAEVELVDHIKGFFRS
jgi:histidyl-tRNA synthetase